MAWKSKALGVCVACRNFLLLSGYARAAPQCSELLRAQALGAMFAVKITERDRVPLIQNVR